MGIVHVQVMCALVVYCRLVDQLSLILVFWLRSDLLLLSLVFENICIMAKRKGDKGKGLEKGGTVPTPEDY